MKDYELNKELQEALLYRLSFLKECLEEGSLRYVKKDLKKLMEEIEQGYIIPF